ncbi:MAG TPA: electron transport complex subunit RsxC, partial [Thauera phenylacetica]|nr:electron transport complex subunit RsxC [Thauera phenylacetica]
ALIAAALARAKAQKAEIQPQNTDNLSPQTQAEIADIEARRKVLEAVAATPAPQAAEAAAAPDEPRP